MRRDDESGAAASMVAFMIAGVLFVGSIGAVIVTTRDSATGSAASSVPAANLKVQAESLATRLLRSPGYTSSGVDWIAAADAEARTANADLVTQLGLKDALVTDSLLMNFTKFQNLRLAPYAEGLDGRVNYPEARRSFGLDDLGLDFHVRAYPTLREIRDILDDGYRDPNMRVAYIGNITNAGGGGGPGDNLGVGAMTCSVDDALHPRAYRIGTTITNGGTAPTQFEAIFDITLPNGEREYHKKNTFVVGVGASVDVRADVAYMGSRSCSGTIGTTVVLRIYDNQNLLKEVTTTINVPGTPSLKAPRALLVELDEWSYVPSEAVTVLYSGVGLTENNKLVLTVCPGDAECRTGSDTSGWRYDITVPKKEKDRKHVISGGFAAGSYTIRLYDNTADPDAEIESDSFRARNRLLVIDPAPGPYVPPTPPPSGYTVGADAREEIEMLERIVEHFCPTYFDRQGDTSADSPIPAWGTSRPLPQGDLKWEPRCSESKATTPASPHPGDVYPQVKKVLKDELSRRLMGSADCDATPVYTWTTVLIVGSNVDHNVMTSGDVKHCIEKWILGGGTLVVFGSVDMNTHWLESVFHTALESSSGGLNVPDAGHPVLHVADDLDYVSYDHERAWRLKTTGSFDAEAAFTRVVNDATSGDAILAVGDPGAFQKGNVILSGWTPYDLRGNGAGVDELEGMKFINNLLMLGYRDLFLDYGPPIPARTNVEPAIAKVHIKHPNFAETILLDISVYVFPG